MAIISGFQHALTGQVKPFELPTDDIAKGLLARQARADEAKNAFTKGDSSLLIDTRPIQGDYDLAGNVVNEYRNDVQKLVDEAGGDWSKIDVSQIQAKAMDYMQDDRTRNLVAYKKEWDTFHEQKNYLDKTFGSHLQFGFKINQDPIYDPVTGLANNPAAWELDKHLDYNKAAHDLYERIGHTIFEAAKKDGLTETTDYYKILEFWERDKDNHKQIDAVINNAYTNFIDMAEGKQYKKMLEAEYRELGLTEEVVQEKVKKKIQNLIFWSGESKKIDEHEEKAHTGIQLKPKEPVARSGGGSGKGEDPIPKPVLIAPQTQTMSHRGATYMGFDNPIDAATAITDPNGVLYEIPESPTDIQNTETFTSYLLETGNVDMPRNAENDLRYDGGLYNLDAKSNNTTYSQPTGNRSVIKAYDPRKLSPADELAKLKEDESLSFSMMDYHAGNYKVTGDFNSTAAMTKFADGKSPWTSMFTINKDDKNMSITIDPAIEKTLEYLNEIANDESKSTEQREVARIKSQRLAEKLSKAYTFRGVAKTIQDADGNSYTSNNNENEGYASAIREYELHYAELLDRKRGLEHLNHTFMQAAELTQTQWDALLSIHRKSDPKVTMDQVKEKTYEQYKLAKLNAYGSIVTGLASSTANPLGVYNELKPYWNGTTEDREQGNRTKQAFGVYMNLVDAIKNGELDMDEIESVVGGDVLKEYTGISSLGVAKGSSPSITYDVAGLLQEYLMKKIESSDIYSDDELQETQKATIVPILTHGLTGVANLITSFDKDKFNYANSPIETQQKYNAARTGNMRSIAGPDSEKIAKYYDLVDTARGTYDTDHVLYQLPKQTTDNENGLNARYIQIVMNALNQGGIKDMPITEVIHNEWGTPAKREAFDVQSWDELMMKKYGSTDNADFKSTLEKGMIINGWVMDPDNETVPGSLVVTLPKADGTKTQVEIPYMPSLTDLNLLSVPVMTAKYSRDIQKGLKESGNTYYDLGESYGDRQMRFYMAHTTLKDHNTGSIIKPGEMYVVGDGKPNNNNTGNYTRIGNHDNAIQYYMNSTDLDKNSEKKEQLVKIYEHLLRVEQQGGNEKAKEAVSKLYFPDYNGVVRPGDIYEELKKLEGEDALNLISGITTKDGKTPLSTIITTIQDPKVREEVSNAFTLDKDGAYTFNTATLSDAALLAAARGANPDIPSEMIADNNPNSAWKGELYPKTEEELNFVNMNDYTSWATINGVRHEYGSKIQKFMQLIDEAREDGTLDMGTNRAYIVSGRRSLRQNMSAYKKDLSSLTNSAHMYGNAIDIRTHNHSDGTHLGGMSIAEFLQTDKGIELMGKAGVRALYHKVKGDNYHIDIAVSDNPRFEGGNEYKAEVERIAKSKK